jgi:hypothetical protein
MLAIALPYAGGKLVACLSPALSVKDMCFPRYEDQIKSECANEGLMYAPMTTVENELKTQSLWDDAVRLVELFTGDFVLRGNKASGSLWKEKGPRPSYRKKSWDVTSFLNSCSIEDKQRLGETVGRLYFGAAHRNRKGRHLYLIVEPDSVLWDDIGLLVKVMRHKTAPTQCVSAPMDAETEPDSVTPQRSYSSRKERFGVGKAKRESSAFISFVVAVSIAVSSMEGGLERAEGSQRASAVIFEPLNDALVLHFDAEDARLLQNSTLFDKGAVDSLVSRTKHLYSPSLGLAPLAAGTESERDETFHPAFGNLSIAFFNFDDNCLGWSVFQVSIPMV